MRFGLRLLKICDLELLFAGCLGATGLTGLWNRSDRSAFSNPSLTGLTGPGKRSDRSDSAESQFEKFPCFASALRLGSFASRYFVHSYSRWPRFEGLRWFWDIGRQFEFRRNFDRLPYTPLWSPVSVPQTNISVVISVSGEWSWRVEAI